MIGNRALSNVFDELFRKSWKEQGLANSIGPSWRGVPVGLLFEATCTNAKCASNTDYDKSGSVIVPVNHDMTPNAGKIDVIKAMEALKCVVFNEPISKKTSECIAYNCEFRYSGEADQGDCEGVLDFKGKCKTTTFIHEQNWSQLTIEFLAVGVDDEFTKRLLREGAALAGDTGISFSLMWESFDDLDIHCICPNGKEIYYSAKKQQGGELDVDMNAGAKDKSDKPVENIVWTSNAPQGTYKVYVQNFAYKGDGVGKGKQIPWELKAVFPGKCSKVFKHFCVGSRTESNVYLTFTYPPKGNDFVDVETIARCIKSTGGTLGGTPGRTQQTSDEKEEKKEESLDMSNPAGWNAAQVAQWVGSLGEKYKPAAQEFLDTGVDGDFLLEIQDADLVDLGMSSRVMRKILLKKVAAFKPASFVPREGEVDMSLARASSEGQPGASGAGEAEDMKVADAPGESELKADDSFTLVSGADVVQT